MPGDGVGSIAVAESGAQGVAIPGRRACGASGGPVCVPPWVGWRGSRPASPGWPGPGPGPVPPRGARDRDGPPARGGGALCAQRASLAGAGEVRGAAAVLAAADRRGLAGRAGDRVLLEVDLEAALAEQPAGRRRARRLAPGVDPGTPKPTGEPRRPPKSHSIGAEAEASPSRRVRLRRRLIRCAKLFERVGHLLRRRFRR